MVHVDKVEALVELQLCSVAQFHLITPSAVFDLHRLYAMLQIAAVLHKVHYLHRYDSVFQTFRAFHLGPFASAVELNLASVGKLHIVVGVAETAVFLHEHHLVRIEIFFDKRLCA